MKKVLLALFVTVGFAFTSTAQDYSQAIGARVGGGNLFGGGLSYKNAGGGYELILSVWGDGDDNSGFDFTGLIENHQPLVPAGLYWYWGYGADVGIREGKNDGFNLGTDGVIGLDFLVLNHLNLSLDIIPRVEIVSNFGDFGWGGNLGIRYAW